MILGSLVKQAIKRQNPGFNERAHGFRAFNELLLEAQKRGLLKLEDDKTSRHLHRPRSGVMALPPRERNQYAPRPR